MPEVYRDLMTCVVCDKGGVSIKICAKCFSVSYCGRECQVADWARHKRLCDSVMVKNFGEKGRGLVASKNFKVGDIIFKDISVASINVADEFDAVDCVEYGKEVYAQISTLSEVDQKTFFELSRSAKFDVIMSDPACRIFPEKFKRAFSIYQNNSMGSGEKDELYLKYSLLNHSCDPNTIPKNENFNGKRMELRAIKEIKVGDEVTTCYIGADVATLGEKKEKEKRLRYWSFQCRCDICLQPATDRIKNLRNEWIEGRLKVKNIVGALKGSKEPSKFLQTFIESLDQWVDLIIKVDKPFLTFNSGSLKLYGNLASMGVEAGRPDLHKKGMSLLKKYLLGDIDKFLLQYENDEKKMMMK